MLYSPSTMLSLSPPETTLPKPHISFVQLTQDEMDLLLADSIFSRLAPVNCDACKSKDGFTRRIWQIFGVAKSKQNDEETQKMLGAYFQQVEKLEYIIYRSKDGHFYGDSAICNACKSTRVVFDISLNAVAALANVVGVDPEAFKVEIEALAKKIEKDGKG